MFCFYLKVFLSLIELITWILPVCGSVHTLTLDIAEPTNGLHNKIGRLEKLKELNISTKVASDLEQVKQAF